MRFTVVIAAFGVLAFWPWAGWAHGPDFDRAQNLFKRTYYDESIKVLQSQKDRDADEWALLGKNWFMLGDFKKSGECFEKALAARPDDSEFNHWMGRVYGRKAESGNPFTAPSNATKARRYFERAVELNPRNGDALGDLFEFYLEAPGFLGGGLDKAAGLLNQIESLDRSERHYAQAKLAEKRRQYSDAEQQLRTAAEMAPRQVGRLLDLAKFLAKQGRTQEADSTFAKAHTVAPNEPKVLFHEAATYIETHRNLDKARELLQTYLKAQLTADDPPREQARKLLKQVQSGS